jgi:hypothetical protein
LADALLPISMFEWLRESIWGYPIIAGIHVLGLAWFGATVLSEDAQLKSWKRVGVLVMLVTGALIFGMHPGQYSASIAFRLKMLLVVLVLGVKLPRYVSLTLWLAIIFAARGIAFF